MAISVLNIKEIRNGSTFPLNSYEEPFGPIEDSIHIPTEALRWNSKTRMAKAVFFSFKRLDEILTNGAKEVGSQLGKSLGRKLKEKSSGGRQVINSRVISGSLARGKHLELPAASPATISLRHLRVDNVRGPPVCVFWDWELSAWSDVGCWVLETNATRTVCQCSHLTNFALLMEEDSLSAVALHFPAFHVEIVVAAVAAVLLIAIVVLLIKV